MARDIAQRFNHTYGVEVLTLPEPHILDEVAVVPGTDGNKMSKSYDNVIRMFWPEKQIKKAVTGSGRGSVAHAGLDGMGEGMAQVEQRALPGLPLVGGNHPGLVPA